jgi:hypothetical protein
MVMIAFELPEALAEQARAAGLLTDQAVREMLEAELKRRQAWDRLFDIAEQIRTAAAPDFAGMTEEEVMDIINEEVRAVREERLKNSTLTPG